jgi:hypothetical protein
MTPQAGPRVPYFVVQLHFASGVGFTANRDQRSVDDGPRTARRASEDTDEKDSVEIRDHPTSGFTKASENPDNESSEHRDADCSQDRLHPTRSPPLDTMAARPTE